jgi:hypothetical protein
LAWRWASSCRHSPPAAGVVADPAGCLLERDMLLLLLLLLQHLIEMLAPCALLPPET